MQELRIAFVPLARPTFDISLAEEVTAAVRNQLLQAGYVLSGPTELVMDLQAAEAAAQALTAVPHDLLLIMQSTFADSTMITALAEATNAPLLMWAVPEAPTGGRLRLNSLCGINLGGHALNLRERKYDYVYAQPGETAVLDKVQTLALAGRAQRALQSAHIGLVGEHPDGMDTCRLDAEKLNNVFGVSVTQFELDELFQKMDQVPSGTVAEVRRQVDAVLPNTASLEQKPLNGTLSAFAVLNQMASENNIDGYAIRCWPEIFEKKGCSACGAMSLLNDAELPSSCEADVNGTVTQLILQAVSGSPTFDVDIVSVDGEQDQVVIWHCGKAPLSMADPTAQPEGGIHSNRKVPLVMEFPLKPGRITAARVSQANGRLTLVVGGGEMLSAPKSFTGTSGVVRFDEPADKVLDTILGEGLEHHLAITYGDYVPAIVALAELLDLPVLML
ncbi:MAG: fucose isomerase [Chloroflexi bacterium]|nr:MAG: fucose isomerase [Chloroflexota bacterium]